MRARFFGVVVASVTLLGGSLAVPVQAMAAAAGLPEGVPPAALRAEPTLPVPSGWPFPESFPRTSGTGRLDHGALFWSDFLYDDLGAVGVQRGGAGLAPSRGTYAYPPGASANNGADIFRAAIGTDGAASYWRVDWNTLVDPSVPIAEFAIDTDASARTGTAAWPAGAGVRSPGVDRFLVVSGKGAWLFGTNAQRTAVESVGGMLTVDRRARSFVVRVPRSALPVGGRSRVRLAAGLADADGTGFAPVDQKHGALPGEPPIYNITFRGVSQEQNGFWMEDRQAQVLALGDVSEFSVIVDWAKLLAGTSTPEPRPRGYTNRWYVSSIELGQGVVLDSNVSGDLRPNFLGRVQPYAVYVPKGADLSRPVPLTWMLHSLGENHNQYGVVNPRYVQQACERRGSICATTLGRGPDGWYFDEAELDFFEVWNRIAGTFALDPERTAITGYSMGGWATYKLGLTYPDLFARAAALAGPPTCGIRVVAGLDARAGNGRCQNDGDSTPLVANARWLPYFIAQGGVDELVPASSVIFQARSFEDLGYRYRLEVYPAEDHLAYAAQDGFSSAAAHLDGRRASDPGRLTYVWYPDLTRPDLGIGATGAWWIRDVRARDTSPGVTARIEVDSRARPAPAVSLVRHAGALVPGDPTPALVTEQLWRTGATPASRNLVTLALTNVAHLRADLGRAGLRAGRSGTLVVGSDGRTELTLLGLRPGASIVVDGIGGRSANAAGDLVVAVDAGAHHITIS